MARTAHAKRRMTVHDWGDLGDDVRGELVDGQLEEEEMPSDVHEVAVAWLMMVVGNWAFPRGGTVMPPTHKVAISAHRGRIPDLALYLPGRKLRADSRVALEAPDAIVEVITPTPRDTKRDRVDKMDDYARAHVRFYWLVDPQMRTFEIFELGKDRRYARAAAASERKLKVPGARGLVLDVTALWREIDRRTR